MCAEFMLTGVFESRPHTGTENMNNGIEAADDNNGPPVLDEAPIISEDEGVSADKDKAGDDDSDNERENENNEVAPAKTAGVCFSEDEVAPAGDPGVSNPEQVAAEMDAQYGHRSGQYVLRQRTRPNRKYLCEDETQFFM
jgi:hypothetical protein